MINSFEMFEGLEENFKKEIGAESEQKAVVREFGLEREKTEEENNASEIIQKLKENGFEAYIVGGYARDLAMSRIYGTEFLPHDIDIASSATSEEVENIFLENCASEDAQGKVFGVMRVKADKKYNNYIEVATFRKETGSKNDQRFDSVSFINRAAEDAKRRDFTVNGMFYDPIEEKIIDYVGGLEDLENKRLRFIGEPIDRIAGKENEAGDYLRLIRAIRFKNRFSFDMPEKDWQAVKDNMKMIHKVSTERINEELGKMLVHPSRVKSMKDLMDSGFFLRIIPEMQNLKGTEQPKEFHKEGDVWNHTIKSLENISDDASIEVVWAVLIHDIGKPIAMKTPEVHGTDRIRFNAHEKESGLVAEMRLRELEFSNEQMKKIKWLVENHMFYVNFSKMSKGKKSELMQNEYFPDLLKVMKADIYGSEPLDKEIYDCIAEEWEIWQSTVKEELKEPLLRGADIMDRLSLKPIGNKVDAKKMGKIAEALRHVQHERFVKDRDSALEFITRLNTPEFWLVKNKEEMETYIKENFPEYFTE